VQTACPRSWDRLSTPRITRCAVVHRGSGTGGGSIPRSAVEEAQKFDYPDGRKTDISWRWARLKDPGAVDDLLSIAKNQDEDKVRRMYAADSLGKIGDAKALPVLRDMFQKRTRLSGSTLPRRYLISAWTRRSRC